MLLLLCQLAVAVPYPPPRAELVLGGATRTTLDLWRPSPNAEKVYVMARLPDGSPALFLLDTGASISVVHREVVEKLGLPVTAVDGRIEGLSGSVEWRRAVIPKLQLGEFQINAVDVAVDVPGVPESAGPLPVAGILGNNVWANFAIEVDYPADVVTLHAPGTFKARKRAAPLVLDGLHAYTPVEVRAADGTTATVVLEVDTGANDVLFQGDTGEPFRGSSTTGVEPVIGIGASLDELPLTSFLQVTRRVPLDRVKIGGRTLDHAGPARWYGADTPMRTRSSMPGLLGYAPMAEHVAVFDFAGEKFELAPSKRAPRDFDAWTAWLALERGHFGEAPDRAAIRGRLQYAKGDRAGAEATVRAALATRPKDAELIALLSWIHRNAKEWDASLAILDTADPVPLAEEYEWVAFIDSLVLAGQVDRALAEAEAAVAAAPADSPARDDLYVALSDALLAAGKPAEAAAALARASEASPGGSGHLVRKARVALVEGDRHAAMVALRELWTLLPLNGTPLWMYAGLTTPADDAGFVTEIDNALGRLHPGDEPWDFAGAALLAVGETARGKEALAKGYARDCAPMREGPDRANCDAWYWALGGERLDEAKARVESAIAERPWASAYQDTAATVAYVSGRGQDAHAHALLAARLSPGDPYLLWQLDRVDAKFPD